MSQAPRISAGPARRPEQDSSLAVMDADLEQIAANPYALLPGICKSEQMRVDRKEPTLDARRTASGIEMARCTDLKATSSRSFRRETAATELWRIIRAHDRVKVDRASDNLSRLKELSGVQVVNCACQKQFWIPPCRAF